MIKSGRPEEIPVKLNGLLRLDGTVRRAKNTVHFVTRLSTLARAVHFDFRPSTFHLVFGKSALYFNLIFKIKKYSGPEKSIQKTLLRAYHDLVLRKILAGRA